MPAPATAAEIRQVNMAYHDGAAAGYDAKWGIDFRPGAVEQVQAKLAKVLGREPTSLGHCLEIGAGTGYLSLNLLLAGLIERSCCTDISEGMIALLRANADRLGLDVETAVCDAEALPFPDGSFDTVIGHAVLHHLPDPVRALRECRRVLRPGGIIAFAGEPSQSGHSLARVPKRAALLLAPAWRAAMRAAPGTPGHNDGGAENHAMEGRVDVHTFTPTALQSSAISAGFADVRVTGEELLANVFGWVSRTLEATAAPETIPFAWRRFAFRGYRALQLVDSTVLEGRLPAAAFYNLMVTARRP